MDHGASPSPVYGYPRDSGSAYALQRRWVGLQIYAINVFCCVLLLIAAFRTLVGAARNTLLGLIWLMVFLFVVHLGRGVPDFGLPDGNHSRKALALFPRTAGLRCYHSGSMGSTSLAVIRSHRPRTDGRRCSLSVWRQNRPDSHLVFPERPTD